MRIRLLIALVLMSGVVGERATAAQSFGEIAKQEEERRKTIVAGKVYTDADLPPVVKAMHEVRQKLSADSAAPKTIAKSESELRIEAAQLFDPVLVEVSKKSDDVAANFRRYFDACYQKYTRINIAGVSGPAPTWTWNQYAGYAWQESWVATASIDNSTTVECRTLWSDVRADSQLIKDVLAEVADVARRRNVMPGTMRDLYDKHRVSSWVQ